MNFNYGIVGLNTFEIECERPLTQEEVANIYDLRCVSNCYVDKAGTMLHVTVNQGTHPLRVRRDVSAWLEQWEGRVRPKVGYGLMTQHRILHEGRVLVTSYESLEDAKAQLVRGLDDGSFEGLDLGFLDIDVKLKVITPALNGAMRSLF